MRNICEKHDVYEGLLTHKDRDEMDNILQTFSNLYFFKEFSEFRLKIHWSSQGPN